MSTPATKEKKPRLTKSGQVDGRGKSGIDNLNKARQVRLSLLNKQQAEPRVERSVQPDSSDSDSDSDSSSSSDDEIVIKKKSRKTKAQSTPKKQPQSYAQPQVPQQDPIKSELAQLRQMLSDMNTKNKKKSKAKRTKKIIQIQAAPAPQPVSQPAPQPVAQPVQPPKPRDELTELLARKLLGQFN